ncbi:MAG TPA: NF038129 family PEP-CTERM protein [Bryobacteraceae bacterium]|nr:NF038129 family PEP-CTERM protein [Bryobacteraceae bacterium]
MIRRFIPLLALALWAAHSASADSVYTFTMDTSALVGNGPFTLDLQFFDGSGTPGDLNNNTVTLTNFAFGTGSASGGGTATGGASGSLAAGVTLQDLEFFNEYYEDFTPGNTLSFTIDTTNVLDPSGNPDLLTVAILDNMGDELPTTGGSDEFLDVSLAGGDAPVITTYGSAPGSQFSLSAPIVLAQSQGPSPVPEPSSYGMLLALAVGLWMARTYRRRGGQLRSLALKQAGGGRRC